MEFTAKINMDNAAFENFTGDELARILLKIATQVQGLAGHDLDGEIIRDINGNKVGKWYVI
jgi:hypothetical protein